jgi:pimeloyl-ACP methyl ester carboxylesterase
MAELARRLPNARLVTLPRGGHFAYLEEPEAFAEHVGQFLAGS